MKEVILDKFQFENFNCDDGYLIFSEQMKAHFEKLSPEEKDSFSFDNFIDEKTEELFQKYDHVVVREDGNIFAVKGIAYLKLTAEPHDGAYECAKDRL